MSPRFVGDKLSTSCCISFLDVALSMTVSSTDSWPEEDGDFASPDEPSEAAAFGSALEVCCKMDILVWIGIPGISLSATAFRIADLKSVSTRI